MLVTLSQNNLISDDSIAILWNHGHTQDVDYRHRCQSAFSGRYWDSALYCFSPHRHVRQTLQVLLSYWIICMLSLRKTYNDLKVPLVCNLWVLKQVKMHCLRSPWYLPKNADKLIKNALLWNSAKSYNFNQDAWKYMWKKI